MNEGLKFGQKKRKEKKRKIILHKKQRKSLLHSFHCKGFLKLKTSEQVQQNTVWPLMAASGNTSKLLPRHPSVLGFFHSFSEIISTSVYLVRPGLSFLFQNVTRPELHILFHNIIKRGVYIFVLLRISLLDYGRDIINQDTSLLFDIITDSNPTSLKVIISIKLYMILWSFMKCWIHINLSDR